MTKIRIICFTFSTMYRNQWNLQLFLRRFCSNGRVFLGERVYARLCSAHLRTVLGIGDEFRFPTHEHVSHATGHGHALTGDAD